MYIKRKKNISSVSVRLRTTRNFVIEIKVTNSRRKVQLSVLITIERYYMKLKKYAVITPNTKTIQTNVGCHDSCLYRFYKLINNRQNILKAFYKSIMNCSKYDKKFWQQMRHLQSFGLTANIFWILTHILTEILSSTGVWFCFQVIS